MDVASIKQEAEGEGEGKDGALLAPRKPWYRQRSLQLVLAGYASIAFLMNFLEELTPIFASAPYTSVSLLSYLGHQVITQSKDHATAQPGQRLHHNFLEELMPIFASARYTSLCRYITECHHCKKTLACIKDVTKMFQPAEQQPASRNPSCRIPRTRRLSPVFTVWSLALPCCTLSLIGCSWSALIDHVLPCRAAWV